MEAYFYLCGPAPNFDIRIREYEVLKYYGNIPDFELRMRVLMTYSNSEIREMLKSIKDVYGSENYMLAGRIYFENAYGDKMKCEYVR